MHRDASKPSSFKLKPMGFGVGWPTKTDTQDPLFCLRGDKKKSMDQANGREPIDQFSDQNLKENLGNTHSGDLLKQDAALLIKIRKAEENP